MLSFGKENISSYDVQHTQAYAIDIEVRRSVKRNAVKIREIWNKIRSLGAEGLHDFSRNRG